MKDPRILSRISIFYGAMLILGGLIFIKVVYLQFFAVDEKGVRYSEKSQRISISKEEKEANRGSIFAHDYRLLATSVPSYTVRMDFRARGLTDSIFNIYVDSLATAHAKYFKDKSANAYKKELIEARKKALSGDGPRVKRIINRKLDYLELQEVKKFPLYNKGRNIGGWVVEQDSRRVYPYQGMARRTIGYMNVNNEGTGLEKSFNEYLAGTKGVHVLQRTTGGGFIPLDSDDNIEPKDGCDIITTIDVDIQDAIEVSLRNQLMKGDGYFEAGTVIVMETKTGAVRGMANMKRNKDGSFSESYNYAVGEAAEPGSTFKLATLIAVLESGNLDIHDEIDCGTSNKWFYKGHTFSEAGSSGLGVASVQKIIERSSNIGVAKMVLQAFEGKESKFTDYLYKLNLNQRLNFDIDGEANPYIKNPHDDKTYWTATSMPQMAAGYEIKLAPIHTLTLYNAIANNGKMVKPKLVNEIRRYGRTEKLFPTQVIKESVCSRKTLEKVQTVLEGVVENGTARTAFRGMDFKIAGKTGTAQIAFGNKGYIQNGKKRHQASFCGYFPAENPQYSCIVVLYTALIPKDANFYGGTWAAPVFKDIASKIYAIDPSLNNTPEEKAQEYFATMPEIKNGLANEVIEVVKKLNIPHTAEDLTNKWVLASLNSSENVLITGMETNGEIMPSVIGMGLKDALYFLEEQGFRVTFTGKGKVQKQSVNAGEKFKKGQTIKLELN